MWNYEKRLQYPVHIKTPNAKIAKIILTQYGGPDARNLEQFFYLFKCGRDLIKKMIQYFSPAGNWGILLFCPLHCIFKPFIPGRLTLPAVRWHVFSIVRFIDHV